MKKFNQIKKNNEKEERIKTFVEEILHFNKAHNIIGRHTKEEVYSSDILDCQTILEHIPSEKKIFDIGSGAGLPGIVIAILKPQSSITMSEKNKKKAYFIKKTIKNLKLTNAEILNTATTPKTRTNKNFDVVTARALAPALQIIKMSEHLLSKNGKYILMKGTMDKIKEEVAQLDNNKYSYNIHKTNITDKQRHILEIFKT